MGSRECVVGVLLESCGVKVVKWKWMGSGIFGRHRILSGSELFYE